MIAIYSARCSVWCTEVIGVSGGGGRFVICIYQTVHVGIDTPTHRCFCESDSSVIARKSIDPKMPYIKLAKILHIIDSEQCATCQ